VRRSGVQTPPFRPTGPRSQLRLVNLVMLISKPIHFAERRKRADWQRVAVGAIKPQESGPGLGAGPTVAGWKWLWRALSAGRPPPVHHGWMTATVVQTEMLAGRWGRSICSCVLLATGGPIVGGLFFGRWAGKADDRTKFART